MNQIQQARQELSATFIINKATPTNHSKTTEVRHLEYITHILAIGMTHTADTTDRAFASPYKNREHSSDHANERIGTATANEINRQK